jgi:WD40 repeat protein
MRWTTFAALLSILLNMSLVNISLYAQAPQAPTAADVQSLQAKYQAERAHVEKAGLAKRFLPVLVDRAEAMAKKAEAALSAGRLLQASELFRQARWQLPYQSPQAPENVSRILGNLRLRHGHEVTALSFSPDGKRLATASRDRTVKVWDMGNGHEAVSYAGHGDEVRTVAFSPDGKQVASGGAQKDVKVWDAATGKDVLTLKGQGAYVTSLVWSPDGKYIVASNAGAQGMSPGVVAIYDAKTGELKRAISDFRLLVHHVALTAEGNILAAGVGDGQIRQWEFPKVAENPKAPEYWAQQDTSGASYHLAFSPDSRFLARVGADGVKVYGVIQPGAPFQVSAPRRVIPPPKPGVRYTCALFSKDAKTLFAGASDGMIYLFDHETGQIVGTFKGHNAEVRALTFNPAGNQLASASADYTVRLWDFDVVLQARDFAGHEGPVWSSVFSPDGQWLASASADRTVRIWEVATGKVRHTLKGHDAPVTVVQFSADGRFVASGGGDASIKLWDPAAGTLLRSLAGHKGTVTTLDISADGKRVVSGSVDQQVIIWDADTGKPVTTIGDNGSVVAAVAFRPDAKQVAVGNIDQSVRLYDLAGKLEHRWTAHGTAVTGVVYSPSGQLLATCGADQLARVWSVANPGAEPITLSGHNGPLSSIAFRGDNQHLVTCGSDQVVKLWKLDQNSGKETQSYRGHKDWVTSVDFSKDGHYVVSSGVDRLVKIWEITSKDIPLASEHTGAVETVAFSPDGTKIASGASDRTIKIWDRATGVELATLTGHTESVIGLAFSPDSKTLVSSGADRNIRVWDVATGKELPRTPGQQQSFTGLINAAPLIALAPDGKKLLAWIPGNERYTTIAGFDLASGKELFSFNDQGRHVHSMAFSADGKTAAAGGRDGGVRLWDLDKRQQLPGGDWFMFDKGVNVADLAVTPDSKTLIVTSESGEVKICDIGKRAVLKTIKAHEHRILAVMVSGDGKRFATLAGDNVIKAWDTASGEQLRAWDFRTPAHDRGGFVYSLNFSPDGRQLVTGNMNTTVFVLDLP